MLRFLFLISILAAPATAQSSLAKMGDGVGETVTLTFHGAALRPVTVFVGLNNGPDPTLSLFTGDPNDVLDVDLSLFLFGGVSLSGFSDATGTLVLPVPVPGDPALPGAVLYLQAITLDLTQPLQSAGFIDEVSNPLTLSLNTPDSFASALDTLATARALHQMTNLDDGRILISGGGPLTLADPVGASKSCEIHEVSTETNALTGSLGVARALHTATRLADGRVLVTGGVDEGHLSPGGAPYVVILNTAEIYDPATGAWNSIPATMKQSRVGHQALLMNDGRVLITGGAQGVNKSYANNVLEVATDLTDSVLNKAEFFNPANNTFTAVGNMNEKKAGHGSALLPNGRILVAGGLTTVTIFFFEIPALSKSCQLFNPATNGWQSTGGMQRSRALFEMTPLPDGRVMATGGIGGDILSPSFEGLVEIYNSTAWSTLGNLASPRNTHTATALADGRVLVAGGAAGNLSGTAFTTDSTEIVDPNASTVVPGPQMIAARGGHKAALLSDNTVLLAGGTDDQGGLATAETYSP